jgi:transposase
MNPELILMQDGAPGRSAKDTLNDLNERGVCPIFWPAFPPDLNPVETVWGRVKDYIERHYPEYLSDGIGNSTALRPFGVCRTHSKVCPSPSFCYRPHFGCCSPVRIDLAIQR